MRAASIELVLVVLSSLLFSARADSSEAHAKKELQSDNYTVTWGAVPTFSRDAELEIGRGSGHGGTLDWLRFVPHQDRVQVLSIKFDDGRRPYRSTWPPDTATVTVRLGWMKPEVYAELLQDLAVVESAKLQPVQRDSSSSSSGNFWVNARLSEGGKAVVTLNWAGYNNSRDEIEFAKPRAMVRLAEEAVKSLDFKDHKLADDERAWASKKFTRDWKTFKGRDFHGWVRERSIQTIGVVGDKSALLALRETLASDPPQGEHRDVSNARCVYHAINAVTRLMKTDVRDRPVEEMDIEKTRRRILELMEMRK